jgi:hypothetical protein
MSGPLRSGPRLSNHMHSMLEQSPPIPIVAAQARTCRHTLWPSSLRPCRLSPAGGSGLVAMSLSAMASVADGPAQFGGVGGV